MSERFVGRKIEGRSIRQSLVIDQTMTKHHGWCLEYLDKHGRSHYRDVNREWLRLHPKATFMMSARLSELKTIGAIRKVGKSDADGDTAEITGYGQELLEDWLAEKETQ